MKREELPGFVRELPFTILTILIMALILASVFWPLISRYYKKRAEGNRSRDAQEILLPDESVKDVPGNVDKAKTNEDSDDRAD